MQGFLPDLAGEFAALFPGAEGAAARAAEAAADAAALEELRAQAED